MNYAEYTTKPPYYDNINEPYYDKGQGVPKLTSSNMTPQDIYRTPFLFLQEHRIDYKNMSDNALKNVSTNSKLSQTYFSEKNIRHIQRLIKREIFKRTKGEFRLDVDQDLKDLFIAMRANYIENARFLPYGLQEQIDRLNKRLVDEITPGIITEIRQYYGYLKEINKPLTPIVRPVNVNNKGRKSLPSITTTWGV